MKALKWFTQRVTGLIVWPICGVVIPYVITKIFQIPGLWSYIDRLYFTLPVLFWFLFIITRGVFAGVWFILGDQLIRWGKKHEFFWFKPEESHYHEDKPSTDKSGEILGYIVFVIAALGVAELAIRLSTWTLPPYPLPFD